MGSILSRVAALAVMAKVLLGVAGLVVLGLVVLLSPLLLVLALLVLIVGVLDPFIQLLRPASPRKWSLVVAASLLLVPAVNHSVHKIAARLVGRRWSRWCG